MNDNLEGAAIFFGLLIILLVLTGILNNLEWIKDIWDILQTISNFIKGL